MSACDLCGTNDRVTGSRTIYSARPGGLPMQTSQFEPTLNARIVTTLQPHAGFMTHHYLICERCTSRAATFTKSTLVVGIVLVLAMIALGVREVVTNAAVPTHFLVSGAVTLLFAFSTALVWHFIDPDKRLKRKAIRARGQASEFGAWTEREFEQAFGKQSPDS